MGVTPAALSFMLVFFVAVGSNEDTPPGSARNISNLGYINILALQTTIFLKEVTSEPLTDNTLYSKSQGHDSHYSNQINVPTYQHKFHQTPDTGLVLKLHKRSNDSVRVFRREAAVEIIDNEKINTSWRQLIRNDTSAFILWDISKRHAGFGPRDGTVDKCLDEFSDRKKAVGPYLLSTTVRENGYFLRGFIHLISKYAYLHDIISVQKHYDKLGEILQDHRSYSVALKKVIENMDPEEKYTITCAQRRFCSCFWPEDVVRFEEQLSSLSQYEFLLGTYLIFGYYIDPTIRVLLIVVGLILNGALIIISVNHNDVIKESIVVVINMAVNSILVLILYVPLQYMHFYYSTIIRHEEFTNNGLFIVVQSWLISVSGILLLTLRVQHHFNVSRTVNSDVSWWSLSTLWKNVTCISTVWVLASSVALITYMFNDHPKFGYLLPPSLYLVLYSFILPIATSRLRIYTEKSLVPSEQKIFISSSAISALSKTFWITHVPLFMWLLLEGLCGFALKLISINYAYVEIMFCYLYFSYTCVNVLALSRANCGFRNLLFRCWHRPAEQQVLMMAVTQRAEPETQSPFYSYCTTV